MTVHDSRWARGYNPDQSMNTITTAPARLRITHAEYWNAKDSKLTQLFKMAKSAITGEPPKNMSEHKELNV